MLSFKSICHCPPSSSSRGSLVTFLFLLLEWYHLHIWSWWYFSWQSWFQLVIHRIQHFPWCVMYSTHNVNKQSDSIQPWCTPFPILNQSLVNIALISHIQVQVTLEGENREGNWDGAWSWRQSFGLRTWSRNLKHPEKSVVPYQHHPHREIWPDCLWMCLLAWWAVEFLFGHILILTGWVGVCISSVEES